MLGLGKQGISGNSEAFFEKAILNTFVKFKLKLCYRVLTRTQGKIHAT